MRPLPRHRLCRDPLPRHDTPSPSAPSANEAHLAAALPLTSRRPPLTTAAASLSARSRPFFRGVAHCGPTLLHTCLRFRQRFGIVADKICRGLGRDTAAAVAECRKTNMYLDDLSCCVGSCGTC